MVDRKIDHAPLEDSEATACSVWTDQHAVKINTVASTLAVLLLVAMIAAGLKRTRSPSAASADQAGNELSPAPVQGSSKDIDGADNKQDDDNGWTAVASSSKKKAKKQKVKKQEVGGHFSLFCRTYIV